jgi:cytochrome b561
MTRHFKVFGMPFPALVGRNHELGDTLAWWHAQVGWLFLSVIALHAMAALFHHYVLRDDVLMTMIPARSAGAPKQAAPDWQSKRRAA